MSILENGQDHKKVLFLRAGHAFTPIPLMICCFANLGKFSKSTGQLRQGEFCGKSYDEGKIGYK